MHKSLLFWIITILTFLIVVTVVIIAFNTNLELGDKVIKALQSASFCLGGYGVFIATYSNIHQSKVNNDKAEVLHQYDVDKATFELIRTWDSEPLLRARDYSRELKKRHKQISPDALVDEITGNAEREGSVVLLFNYCDCVRVALENKLINPNIMKSLYPAMLDILERFRPYIESRSDSSSYLTDYNQLLAILKAK